MSQDIILKKSQTFNVNALETRREKLKKSKSDKAMLSRGSGISFNQVHLDHFFKVMTGEEGGLALETIKKKKFIYYQCFTADDFITWVVFEDVTTARASAVGLGQRLLDGKYIYPMKTENTSFQDNDDWYYVSKVERKKKKKKNAIDCCTTKDSTSSQSTSQ